MNYINVKEKDLEPIIKELLYEASARQNLNTVSESRFSRKWTYTVGAIAASLLVLVVAFQTIPGFNGNSNNQLVAQNYEFPTITKARSGKAPVVDQYITQLQEKDYKSVLTALNNESNLSEQDKFVKAHLLFSTEELSKAESLINATVWQDEYIKEEIDWLSFLINVKQGEKNDVLIKASDLLSSKYAPKASQILKQLK